MPSDATFRRQPKRRIVTAGIIAAAMALGGCGIIADTNETETTLHFQELFAPGDAFADSDIAYSDAVIDETDGAVDFKFHWSSSVVPSDQVAGAMDDDLIDMARLQPPASPADYPVTNWLASSAHHSTSAFPAGLLQQIGAHAEFAMDSPELNAEVEDLGIRYIAPVALVQQYDLLCDRPIESEEDFQGTRVRVAGPTWVNEIRNLGGQPVSLPAEEIYQGFQRGIVDCVMTYPTHYIDSGLWELGGYYVPLSFTGWNQDAVAISQETWETLTPETQKALESQTREWIREFVQRQINTYWRFAVEGEEQGIAFMDHNPDMQATINEHQDSMRQTMIENAPPQVSDPEAMLTEYEEIHDEWLPIIDELGFETEGAGLNDWIESMEDPTQPPDIDLDPWLDEVMENAYGHTGTRN